MERAAISAAETHPLADQPDASAAVEPRRADFERWRRRSRLIHILRRVLPALMALIVLALGGGVVMSGFLAPTQKLRDALGAIHMINPRYQGRDNQGRAFVLQAREAARDPNDQQLVLLQDPFVSLAEDTPTPTRLMAKTGVYRESDRMLHLYGDVRLDDGSGYRFASQEAVVDTRKGEVVGQSDMASDGPMGQIKAGSYGVFDKGKRAIFKGGVRARLNQH